MGEQQCHKSLRECRGYIVRNLDLLDSCGSLRQDADQVFEAVSYFPEDDLGRQQYKFILEIEENRRLAEDNYQRSSIRQTIEEAATKRLGQLAVTGLTALALAALSDAHSPKPSKYQATRMVSRYLRILKSANGHPLHFNFTSGKERMRRGIRAPLSPEDIAKQFNANASVAHIWAGRMIGIKHPKFKDGFGEPMDNLSGSIRAAAENEIILASQFPDYFVNPWSLRNSLPDNLRGLGQSYGRRFGSVHYQNLCLIGYQRKMISKSIFSAFIDIGT